MAKKKPTKPRAKKSVAKKPASTGGKQHKPWQFKPGQSGNPKGRPKGSKQKLSEDFVSAFAADFEQHGESVILKVREEDPTAYLNIITKIIPKDVNVKADATETFVNLLKAVSSGSAGHMSAVTNGLAAHHDEARPLQ